MSSILQLNQNNLKYLLNLVKDEIKREINCHVVGTIITFDATTATASVAFNYKKVLYQRNAISDTDYTDVIIDYPVLVRVPVIVIGGGGAYTTYPIFSGDQCLLMFCDRDIDNWLEYGDTNSAPGSERKHDISDAVAIVGLNSTAKPIQWATDAIQTIFGNVMLRLTNLIASLTDITGQRLCQSGFLQPYSGSSAPSGWLLCYGQAVSRSTYSYLFAVVGTTYGSGDGLTTFNLPDMRGRTVAGLDNMGGSDANVLTSTYTPNRNTLGGKSGEEAHVLTYPELPAPFYYGQILNTVQAGSDYNVGWDPVQGSSVPHNNVQPSLMVNWIIKI